ncbi:MAG: hypothetical protein AAGF12_36860 [Myxococcota bacterium]
MSRILNPRSTEAMRFALPAVLLALASLLYGCGDECDSGSLLSRSCGGCAVPNCRVSEYATVRSAEISPREVTLGDPTLDVTFDVSFDTCGDATPGPHEIRVQALAMGAGGTPDASGSERLFSIITLEDNGRRGDAVAMDGEISVTVGNPFGTDLPPNTDLQLRFVPFLNTCEGDTLEQTYRTGDRFNF